MANRRPSMSVQDAAPGPEEIETAGEAFADGTMLELIREGSRTSLVRWDGNKASIGQRFYQDGRVYVPRRLDSTIVRALRLPENVAPYGSARELFNGVSLVLTRFTRLPERFVSQIVYFLFGTWLVDCLLVAPFLYIVAPVGSARAQLLRLLSVLCRRALMLADASPSTLCSAPIHLAPTFFFDEANLSDRFLKFLYSTNTRGNVAFRNQRMLDVFSAKVVCSQEPLVDPLLGSQALQVVLEPTCGDLPVLAPEVVEQIAAEFQPQFLMYRLKNHRQARTPGFDVSDLTGPMQDLARALGASIVEDDELQHGVIPLLRERDQDVQVERSTSVEGTILEAAVFHTHLDGRSYVLSGELADTINTLWAERGEGRRTSPESVGRKLNALGLHTEPIGGRGNGLQLTEAVRARLHELLRIYDVRCLQRVTKDGCRHCAPPSETTAGQ